MPTTIATGRITLTSTNDAYTVSLAPNTCVIRADCNGQNPILNTAYTNVRVYHGSAQTLFSLQHIASSPDDGTILYSITNVENNYTKQIRLTSIPNNVPYGELYFSVYVGNDIVSIITFQYSVIRETSMLDWILDWNTNKTAIGADYVITPKLFVGQRDSNGVGLAAINGVYIGPDENNGDGIYGFKGGQDIFHINESGALIGGWIINQDGISSPETVDGRALYIQGDGSIYASKANGAIAWQIQKTGEASFANGNVQMHADGSASFVGSITAASGAIGGWTIGSNSIYSTHVLLDSSAHYIGIAAKNTVSTNSADQLIKIGNYGGVYMHFTTSDNFGIVGVNTDGNTVFQLGSTNQISGWNFDSTSLWIGTKQNLTGNYTANGITIGSHGLRGTSWYIDTDGSVSFINGKVNFTPNASTIAGWYIDNGVLRNTHIGMVSNEGYSGLFFTPGDLSNTSINLYANSVRTNGGIYIQSLQSGAELAGYKNNLRMFSLTSVGTCQIAGWSFNAYNLYVGTEVSGGFTTHTGDITMGATGVRGFKWRLESDGSGALAGGNIAWNANGSGSIANGNISWDANGAITLSSNVTISFSQCTDGSGNSVSTYLTNIGIDGIYTGTIHANEGYIGAWHINTNEQIVSNLSTDPNTNKIILDASHDSISLYSSSLNGVTNMMTAYSNIGSIININANSGIIETQAKNPPSYSTAVSYISPTGVFANFAGTQAIAISTGLWHQAAVVGLGFANVNKSEWSFGADETVVAGVYGRASNAGTAPAFGGYFWNLKACGLVLNRVFISDNTGNGYSLSPSDTLVIGLCNQNVTRTVYLPSDSIEGRIVIVEQMGQGKLRMQTKTGQSLYEGITLSDYCEVGNGEMAILIFGIWAKGGVTTQIWTARKIRY